MGVLSSKDSGARLHVAHEHRWWPLVRRSIKWLRSRRVGLGITPCLCIACDVKLHAFPSSRSRELDAEARRMYRRICKALVVPSRVDLRLGLWLCSSARA